jgi:formylglycine-generating enzyme required for sulfatase activity
MVSIPGGAFMMGSVESEAGRAPDEGPQHNVRIAGFRMGKYEVTQKQWRDVMGTEPSGFTGGDRPVENVSWSDAVEFCRKLSRLSGISYRLPTEAEWEYAARAGTTTPVAFGDTLAADRANFDGDYPYGLLRLRRRSMFREQTIKVGSFQPNLFGLFDMHGNVAEWCQDDYHDSYDGAPSDGSAWSGRGIANLRVVRGGSWRSRGPELRSARREGVQADARLTTIGFRVVSDAVN